MEELITAFYEDLASESLDKVMLKFFNFPTTKDFVSIIQTKIEMIIMQGETNEAIVDFYKLLTSVLEDPNLIYTSIASSKDVLLDMLKTEQLDYDLTSVEYVDGVLKYCIKQNPSSFIFNQTFNFDCYTDFTFVIEILSGIIRNNPKIDNISLLRARLALLRKLNGLVDSMTTPKGCVVISKVSSRPKITSEIKDDCTTYMVA